MPRGWVYLLNPTWLMVEEAEGNQMRVDEGKERKILRIERNEPAVFLEN